MGQLLQRECTVLKLALKTDATSPAIPFGNFAGGRIVPTGSITSFTYYESFDGGTTWYPCYDSAATPAAIAQTSLTAGRSYPIPVDMFGSKLIQIRVDAAGTAYLSLKG
jgi:hypothetical protein